MTLTFHIDGIKILHLDPEEVTKLIKWFKLIYGKNFRVSRGTTHNLGMMLSYSNNQVRISMADYFEKVINGSSKISMEVPQHWLGNTFSKYEMVKTV